MQDELAQIEAANRPFLISRREIDVTESSDLKRRIVSLGVAGVGHAGLSFRWWRGRSRGQGWSLNRAGWSRTGALGSILLALVVLKLVDPCLQLLNTVEQTLDRWFARSCPRWRLRQRRAGGQRE